MIFSLDELQVVNIWLIFQIVVDIFQQLYSYMWLVPEKIEQKYAINKEKELDKKLASIMNEGSILRLINEMILRCWH